MSNLAQNLLAVVLILGMLLIATAVYFPSYREGRTNGKTTLATERLFEYAVWRDRNPPPRGSYPPEKLLDPFTGKPFLLIEGLKNGNPGDGGNPSAWFLIAPGPDKRFDCGADRETFSLDRYVPYDPTNGIHSPGDILIGSDISPEPRGKGQVRPGQWESSKHGYTRRKAN